MQSSHSRLMQMIAPTLPSNYALLNCRPACYAKGGRWLGGHCLAIVRRRQCDRTRTRQQTVRQLVAQLSLLIVFGFLFNVQCNMLCLLYLPTNTGWRRCLVCLTLSLNSSISSNGSRNCKWCNNNIVALNVWNMIVWLRDSVRWLITILTSINSDMKKQLQTAGFAYQSATFFWLRT